MKQSIRRQRITAEILLQEKTSLSLSIKATLKFSQFLKSFENGFPNV